jgi:hypothetical protein
MTLLSMGATDVANTLVISRNHEAPIPTVSGPARLGDDPPWNVPARIDKY